MTSAKVKIVPPKERKVKEVKTVWDETEANQLLKSGWELMHAGIAHQDSCGYQARNIFVLARYG